MSRAVSISPLAARCFAVRATGLGGALASTLAAIQHLGYVQIDPLNICGRMHDLILRNRVPGYRPGDLTRTMHGDDVRTAAEQRTAFEHHLPGTNILAAFPADAWPHFHDAMTRRARRHSGWSGRLTPAERRLAPQLLNEIQARGPLGSEDFGRSGRSRAAVWGAATVVKNTLQKLFFHGELLIAGRSQGRRRYDLPERALPARILRASRPSAEETALWLARLKLRQRRLAVLKRNELELIRDQVQAVAVTGCRELHCLSEDVPLLEACAKAPAFGGERVSLLAPLDPLIYDRALTSALWGFDYTWEAYTPPAKRVRGHYALPVLRGLELVGHVEPKANRTTGRLEVASRAVRRGVTTAEALDELAAWLELRR